MTGHVIVIDQDVTGARYAGDILAAGSWRVATAGSLADMTAADLADAPLIILCHHDRATALDLAGLTGTPVLLVLPSVTDRDDPAEMAERAAAHLGTIRKPFAPATLIAEVMRLAGPAPEGPYRLLGLFGDARINDLLRGLEEQLATAAADMQGDGRRDVAHRLGGLAGTLGFALLASQCLAIAEGDDSGLAPALRTIRYAREHIRQLIRFRGNH